MDIASKDSEKIHFILHQTNTETILCSGCALDTCFYQNVSAWLKMTHRGIEKKMDLPVELEPYRHKTFLARWEQKSCRVYIQSVKILGVGDVRGGGYEVLHFFPVQSCKNERRFVFRFSSLQEAADKFLEIVNINRRISP